MPSTRTLLAAFTLTCLAAAPGLAWDATGHRMITKLAVEGMTNAPDWLKDADTIAQIADGATVPDRWRSEHIAQLSHVNGPDHYLDVEDLDAYGLSLKTLPPLRYEFIKQMVLAKEKAGPNFKGRPVNPARDTDKTQELPGFVPYAIAEEYGRLQSAFRTIRTLEKLDQSKLDAVRKNQLQMARENAKYNMGLLAHYVGDAAQPLHMTKHHHGWVGDNPKGYTTDNKFHSYIDGGVIKLHHISAKDVQPFFDAKVTVNAKDPWPSVISYLDTTYQTVEPLYELKKTGDLEKDKGKDFIEHRLAAGASELSALYRAAWDSVAPTDKDMEEFTKYDGEKDSPAPAPKKD